MISHPITNVTKAFKSHHLIAGKINHADFIQIKIP